MSVCFFSYKYNANAILRDELYNGNLAFAVYPIKKHF